MSKWAHALRTAVSIAMLFFLCGYLWYSGYSAGWDAGLEAVGRAMGIPG